MLKKTLPLYFALMLTTQTALAASFDCSQARNWTEKAICSDKQLSDLDELLLASYKKAVAHSGDAVKYQQREWLKYSRNSCQDIDCLKAAYTQRLNELNRITASTTTTAPVSQGISGVYQRFIKNKPDPETAEITLRELKGGKVYVQGSAIWQGGQAVHTGELDHTVLLNGNRLYYQEGDRDACALTIHLMPQGLKVTDDNMRCGGLNVSFDGNYRKIK